MGIRSKLKRDREPDRPGRWSWRKRWAFRLAAVACGLVPLVLLEWILALLNWADPRLDNDPYVGFRQTRPLFVLDESKENYSIPAARLNWFCPESFPSKKSVDEFRVFCLGGSTVQGRPFAKETAFSTWLERDLKVADPSKNWRVINCGGVSYASYRLVLILNEVLQYSPDLVILYTGHNEFLEDRSYAHIRERSAAARWFENLGARSRLVTILSRATRKARATAGPDPRTQLASDVNAALDNPDGLRHYQRNDEWRRKVIDHFDFNLRRMIAMCRQRKVPVLLVNPTSNLRDSPPFKAQHRDGLSDAEMTEWQRLVQEARTAYRTDMWKACSLLQKARAIDGRHAGLLYKLAKCYDRTGRLQLAREAYVAAKEEDICPLRMLEPMHDIVMQTARRSKVPCYDARTAFESLSPDGIVGSSVLLDHVHPSVTGHQRIAEDLVELMATEHMLRADDEWRTRARAGYSAYLESLDRSYFPQGLARLEGLQRWARQRENIFDRQP